MTKIEKEDEEAEYETLRFCSDSCTARNFGTQ